MSASGHGTLQRRQCSEVYFSISLYYIIKHYCLIITTYLLYVMRSI